MSFQMHDQTFPKMESATTRRVPGGGNRTRSSNHNIFYGGAVGGSSSNAFAISHYMTSILRNRETRNVFFFLLLNVSFCFVEFLWGYWSNSLGLTSVLLPPISLINPMPDLRMLFICSLILRQSYSLL